MMSIRVPVWVRYFIVRETCLKDRSPSVLGLSVVTAHLNQFGSLRKYYWGLNSKDVLTISFSYVVINELIVRC